MTNIIHHFDVPVNAALAASYLDRLRLSLEGRKLSDDESPDALLSLVEQIEATLANTQSSLSRKGLLNVMAKSYPMDSNKMHDDEYFRTLVVQETQAMMQAVKGSFTMEEVVRLRDLCVKISDEAAYERAVERQTK